MTVSRLDLLKNNPYRRLAELLGDAEPGKEPLFLQVGEPQDAVPDIVAREVAANAALFGKYPPPNGSPGYQDAVARWLERRYGLNVGSVDAGRQVLALCGTREGLFQAALVAILRKRERLNPSETPAVLLPNPMYHVYFGGAVVGEADPILVNADAETGFVPDFAGLPTEVLDRAAICYFCTPGNPTGAVAKRADITRMLALARKHDFVLAVDECYSEIWFDTPPAGGFDAAVDLGGDTSHLLVLNSLSKRSGSPGLRCGFVAGDPALIESFAMLRSYGGAQVPGPLMAAGEALWRDEAHVEENRRHYSQLVAIADRHLAGVPGYVRPEAGFFLWLDTTKTIGDGETAAKRLWSEVGVKALPGRYMARPDPETGGTPGDAYIRLALVHDPARVEEAMSRVASVLKD
ncbi:aminotransferase class I/II-fold pyridoxal phosphate-dependent enzyme [Rhodospirillaceae bacterium KN72]|uniref:Aminotransferase class I/II-fold pyridoxal phosphate-dependent enzyme n=1 Tax=Pacificispira spongiicola TaxID=2729598 RepID=A0A7Y0HHC2_9PROT|nr:aminotransferase class I/II-fold pyridoxal phosphate-dependent enzyme [Pacificispira spongiicola]NMM45757.1 aminotransferase class I/II-fold pyridoxal phosphate-dependent enzyme [Pacificispira spongiicola]